MNHFTHLHDVRLSERMYTGKDRPVGLPSSAFKSLSASPSKAVPDYLFYQLTVTTSQQLLKTPKNYYLIFIVKKERLFIIIGILVLVTVFSFIILSFNNELSKDSISVENGVFVLPEIQDQDLSCNLFGKWELYPGIHLVTDSENISVKTYSAVPGNITKDTIAANGKYSYRIMVNNLKTDGPVLILPEMYCNYHVFIDRKLCQTRTPSPWGFPVYSLSDYNEIKTDPASSKNIEIIIEIDAENYPGIISMPRIMSLKNAMHKFDYSRFWMLIFISGCCMLILVMIIIGIIEKNREILMYSAICFIFMIIYIINMIWALGITDTIVNTCLGSFDLISYILTGAGIIGLIIIQSMFNLKEKWFSGCIMACLVVLSGIIIRQIFASAGLMNYFAWIQLGLYLCLFFIWLLSAGKNIKAASPFFLTMSIGELLLFIASAINYSYLTLKVSYIYDAPYPVCLLLFLLLSFISTVRHIIQRFKIANKELKHEIEMSKMQNAIIVSQLKPHFLYNTLTIIQELCFSDSEKAALLIVKFSKYLRSSIDILDYDDLIPFEVENETIDNFVYIQKERFGDALQYTSNIMFKDFKIPPFSVQPIVENAIKCGVR